MAQEGCACYFCCSLEIPIFCDGCAGLISSSPINLGQAESSQAKPSRTTTKTPKATGDLLNGWPACRGCLLCVPAMRAYYGFLFWVPIWGAHCGCPLMGACYFWGAKNVFFRGKTSFQQQAPTTGTTTGTTTSTTTSMTTYASPNQPQDKHILYSGLMLSNNVNPTGLHATARARNQVVHSRPSKNNAAFQHFFHPVFWVEIYDNR